MKKIIFIRIFFLFASGTFYPVIISAQESSSRSITILEAINLAKENYPAIRAARARTAAANAEIGIAQASYIPRFDLLWQENRATRNNVFGMMLPQSVIPSISGPVLGLNSHETGWGSAGGALLSWELYDFGRRGAQVEAARALHAEAGAQEDLTLLSVTAGAANAFVSALAADQAAKAAQANVERMKVFFDAVTVLFNNQLRPGVDKAHATAELASAQIQLIKAEQLAKMSHFNLVEALGETGKSFTLDSEVLLKRIPETQNNKSSLTSHPLTLVQATTLEAERARKRILGRSYFPRFNLQFAYYIRGTGNLLNGGVDLGKGLAPDVSNWATGLTVTLPFLDMVAIRKSRRASQGRIDFAQAQYDGTVQRLETEIANAEETAKSAFRIAEKTPVQLEAARETQVLTRARYDAGLATVMEVAESERLLTQAEIDDAVARLNVWRAVVNLAMAKGDLNPVLEEIKTGLTERKP